MSPEEGSFILEQMEKERNKKETKIRYETCVCCQKKLDILVDTEIDFRPFYVEGAGQLCYDCYHQLYK